MHALTATDQVDDAQSLGSLQDEAWLGVGAVSIQQP